MIIILIINIFFAGVLLMKSKLHKGHRERLRNRFIETEGIGFFKHEIIELLLFYAIPRANTNETAHALLDEYRDNLNDLFNAGIEELCDVDGIGKNTALFIKLIFDISKHYPDFSEKTNIFNNLSDIEEYFADVLSSYPTDYCYILNLSQRLEIINIIKVSFEEIYLKSKMDIADEILKRNPHNIVIGVYHNKESSAPTKNDYDLCKKMIDVLESIEIPVIDFIVCSTKQTFSMRKAKAFSF